MNQESEIQLNEYRDFLIKVLGYSQKTAITYLFYVKKLTEYNMNYKVMLNSFGDQTNNTKRVILSAVKNFYQYTKNNLCNEIVLPKKDRKIKDYITFEEYRKLLDFYYDSDLKKIIFRILFETGIRSSEFLSIRVSDIEDQKIIINGKGKKQRIVYTSIDLCKFIHQYIIDNKLKSDDYILNFGYRNLYKHIQTSGSTIDKNLSPHMFRRGFATYCMEKDIGIYEICLMMGHENINTTKTYLRNENKIEVMKNIFA